jgi:hypothetical protein
MDDIRNNSVSNAAAPPGNFTTSALCVSFETPGDVIVVVMHGPKSIE